MLAVSIDGFGLVEDTGVPGDLITTNPELSGVVNGDFYDGYADVVFDVDGDGLEEEIIDIDAPGMSFNFDPSLYAAPSEDPITIDYWYREYDEWAYEIETGSVNSFTFTWAEPDPAIGVLGPDGETLEDGVEEIDFGVTEVGTPVELTFVIENAGEGELELDPLSLSVPTGFLLGINFDEFAPAGESTSFTITLEASSAGVFSGTVSFDVLNDPQYTSFSFDVKGEVVDVSLDDLEQDGDGNFAGTANGDFNGNSIRIDFAHGCDVGASVSVSSPGQAFLYNPLAAEPTLAYFGGSLDLSYRYVVLDSNGNAVWTGDWGSFSLTYSPPQSGPVTVASHLGSRMIFEDSEDVIIDLRDIFQADPEEVLEFDVTNTPNPDLVQWIVKDWALRLRMEPDANGCANIVVEAKGKTSNDTAKSTLRLHVKSVNDHPTTTGFVDPLTGSFEPLTLTEDFDEHTFSIANVFSDLAEEETPDLRYAVSLVDHSFPGNPIKQATIDGTNIKFQSVDDMFGWAQYSVQATDDDGGSVATTLWVVVDPSNDTPTKSEITDMWFDNFSESSIVVDLWRHFSDVEDRSYLDYSIGPPSDGSIFESGPTISDGLLMFKIIEPPLDQEIITTVTLTVTASDRDGGSVQDSFDVSVEFIPTGSPTPTPTGGTPTCTSTPTCTATPTTTPVPEITVDLDIGAPDEFEEGSPSEGQMRGVFLAVNDDHDEGNLGDPVQVELADGVMAWELERAADNQPDRGLSQGVLGQDYWEDSVDYAGSYYYFDVLHEDVLHASLSFTSTSSDPSYPEYGYVDGALKIAFPDNLNVWAPASAVYPGYYGYMGEELIERWVALSSGHQFPVAQSLGRTIPLVIEAMSDEDGQGQPAGSVDLVGEFVVSGEASPAASDTGTIHVIGLSHDGGDGMLLVNGGDKDHDGVADSLDGFNLDSYKGVTDQSEDDIVGASSSFAPVTVKIPQSVIDLGEARVRIVYAASDPLGAGIGPTGSRLIAPGALRLWTIDEAAARDPHSVEDGGHFLASSDSRWFWNANFWGGFYAGGLWTDDSGQMEFIDDAFYDPTGAYSFNGADSFALDDLGNIDEDGNLTFYVEGLHPGEFSVQVLVAPNEDSGYVLREVVDLEFGNEVTIAASDAFGAETSDGSDAAAFTISRGEGVTTGNLNVYYQLVIDPDSAYAHDPYLRLAAQDFTASYLHGYDNYGYFASNYQYWLDSVDYGYWMDGGAIYDPFTEWYFDSLLFADPAIDGFYSPGDGVYTNYASLVRDSFTMVGTAVIPHGQSAVDITINPVDDDRTEWDEVITLQLITYQQYVDMHKNPPSVGVSDSENSYDINNPYTERRPQPTHPAPNNAHPGGASHYILGASSSATVTILDNDHIDGQTTRNVDVESTGLVQEMISNGAVAVSVYDGSLTLVLPLGDIPNYRSNDNLRTLVDVEMRIPWNESQFPSALSGKLTVAGVQGASIAFPTTPLNQYLAENPARTIRLVVVGPSDLEDFLPTGHYDYDVEFTATIDGKEYDRTVRGATEIINLVGDVYGTDEFGKRWWLDGLDRLAPSDNITPQGPASDVNGNSTASRLAAEGATPHQSGVALIRGDNTSAWYVSSEVESETLDVNSTEDAAHVSFGPIDDGGWGHAPGYLYSSAGLAEEQRTVSWQFTDLDVGGQYQLFVNYRSGPDRASNAPYTITGAQAVGSGAATKTVYVDQRYAARNDYSWGDQWRSLGFYVATGDTITVTLSTQIGIDSFADGVVVADQAKIVKQWNYFTPDGSINKLLYGELQYEDPFNPGEFLTVSTGGFWVDPDYDPQPGHFTLLTKYGDHYDFNAQGLLEATQDPNRNRVELAYIDADNDSRVDELQTITTQGGLTTTFVYNGDYLDYVSDYTQSSSRHTDFVITAGQVTDVYQPFAGFVQPHSRFVYDANDYLTNVWDGEDNHTVVTITAEGQVSGVQDPDATSVSWSIQSVLASGLGFVKKPGDGEIGVHFDPYEDGPLYQARAHYTDPRGINWRYQTDDFGLLLAHDSPTTSSSNQEDVWRWERNKHGLVTKSIEPAGGGGYDKNLPELETTYTYTTWYDLESVKYADDTTESWTYSNHFHAIASHTNQLQQTTQYQRDARGNLERLIEPAGPHNPSRTTHFTYTPPPTTIAESPGGLVRITTQAEGTSDEVKTKTDYYQSGLHIGLVSQETYAWQTPVETWVQYEYAPGQRNPLLVRDELGRETQTHYDNLDRLVQVIQPNGGAGAPTTVYQYDAVGNQVAVIVNGAETTYQYDGMNRLRWVLPPVAPGGHAETLAPAKTEYQYDANGNLLFEILHVDGADAFSQTADRFTGYIYDARNLVQQSRQNAAIPSGIANAPAEVTLQPIVEYRYDALGNLRFSTSPRGLTDSSGTTIKTKYHTDKLGRVWKVESPSSSETWATDGGHASPEVIKQYDDLGRILQVSTSTGTGSTLGQAVTKFTYDAFDRLVREYAPADANGDILETIFEYDLRDNLIGTIQQGPGFLPRGTRNYYDDLDRLIAVDHPDPSPWQLGTVTFYAYNQVGDLQRELVHAGAISPTTELHVGDGAADDIDADAIQLLSQNRVARLTKYTTNSLGQVTSVTAPDVDGNGALAPTVTTYLHDVNGAVTSTTVSFQEHNSEGQIASGSLTTTTQYDALGRAWKTIQPSDDFGDHLETETVYNRDGSVAKSIFKEFDYPSGEESRDTQYEYDLSGRLVHTASPEPAAGESRLHTWQFYDRAGNLIRDIAANGQITNYAYDFLDRRITIDPVTTGLPTQSLQYYADGTLLQHQVGVNVVDYTYDALGRMLSETKHDNGQTLTTFYDRSVFGDIVRVEDPSENITYYQYDSYGRVSWEAITPGGIYQRRRFNRDEFGNIIQAIDRLGRTIQYEYNQVGLKTTETWYDTDTSDAIPLPITTGFTKLYEAEFSYTGLGELQTASDETTPLQTPIDNGGSSYVFQYDQLRRVKEVDGSLPYAPSFTTKYTHTLSGQRQYVQMLVDGDIELTNTYIYDNLNRPEVVTWGDGSEAVHFEYDGPNLQYVRRKWSNIEQLVSRLTFQEGRFTDITYAKDQADLDASLFLFNKHVAYNDQGLIHTTESKYYVPYNGGGGLSTTHRTFTYDDLNQLEQITTGYFPIGPDNDVTTTQNFDFDSGGNNVHAEVDEYNRLRVDDAGRMSYDDEGNVLSRWEFNQKVEVDLATALSNEEELTGTREIFVDDPAGAITLSSGWHELVLKDVELTASSNDVEQLRIDIVSRYGGSGLGHQVRGTVFVDLVDKAVPDLVIREEWLNEYGAVSGIESTMEVHVSYVTYHSEIPEFTGGTIQLKRLNTVQEYEWDHHNRLSKAIVYEFTEELESGGTTFAVPDSTDAIFAKMSRTVEFGYDVLGQRVSKSVTTHYSNDTRREVQIRDRGNVVLEYGFNADVPIVLQTHVYTSDSSWLLATENADPQSGPALYWAITDESGALSAVLKSGADYVDMLEFDAFGQPKGYDVEIGQITNYTGFPNTVVPIGFAGREFDPETGLYFDGARYTTPVSGRFLSETHGGPLAGDTNLYRDLGNSPPNRGLLVNMPNRNSVREYSALAEFLGDPVIVGSFQVVGGSIQAVGGVLFAGATWESGIGPVAGLLVAARGVDDVVAGVRTIASGQVQDTFTYQASHAAAYWATGSKLEAAKIAAIVDISSGIVSPAFAAGTTVKAIGAFDDLTRFGSRFGRTLRRLRVGGAARGLASTTDDAAELVVRAAAKGGGCFVGGTEILVLQSDELLMADWQIVPAEQPVEGVHDERQWDGRLLLAAAGAFAVAGTGAYAAQRRRRRRDGQSYEDCVDAFFESREIETLWREALKRRPVGEGPDELAFE
ncbi:MAG: choice-of-anchor D domain-containing protein [Pirellulaceae bacterium]